MPQKHDTPVGRGRDEIVEEIVDHLRPWKTGNPVVTITAAVHRQLDWAVKAIPMEEQLFDRAQIRAHAQKLDHALDEVQNLVASAPAALALSFFFNPLLPGAPTDDGELVTPSIDRAREASFLAELKRLREICARAVNPGFGHHPNYDHVKHLCAWAAHGLMREFSKARITGTKDSAFRVITGLLYEALSGQPEADLKRPCDSVLKHMNVRYRLSP